MYPNTPKAPAAAPAEFPVNLQLLTTRFSATSGVYEVCSAPELIFALLFLNSQFVIVTDLPVIRIAPPSLVE